MSTLYRAQYRTLSGTVRRMTFACYTPAYARAYAESWRNKDTLIEVSAVRECERPEFKLQANLIGV